jgi:hypothetical protein
VLTDIHQRIGKGTHAWFHKDNGTFDDMPQLHSQKQHPFSYNRNILVSLLSPLHVVYLATGNLQTLGCLTRSVPIPQQTTGSGGEQQANFYDTWH